MSEPNSILNFIDDLTYNGPMSQLLQQQEATRQAAAQQQAQQEAVNNARAQAYAQAQAEAAATANETARQQAQDEGIARLNTRRAPSIPSYETGVESVPATGLAVVHKGEKITPASENADNPDIVLGARQIPNPKGITPRLDTDTSTQPTRLSKDTILDKSLATKPTMYTESPPTAELVPNKYAAIDSDTNHVVIVPGLDLPVRLNNHNLNQAGLDELFQHIHATVQKGQ